MLETTIQEEILRITKERLASYEAGLSNIPTGVITFSKTDYQKFLENFEEIEKFLKENGYEIVEKRAPIVKVRKM